MQKQAGQVLLIVVLVTIVASTIGLSIATRSITSLKTSTEEAESQKALAAAEAGIERSVQGNTPIAVGDDLSNNSSYLTEITPVNSASFLMNGGNVVPKDEGADIWFANHTSDGRVDYSPLTPPFDNYIHLYWGSSSEACTGSNLPAAIQAIAVSRDSSGVIKSYRYAYDSCSSRRSENNFTQADNLGGYTVPGITGITFQNRTPENNNSSDLAYGINDIVFIRVIPIYKDAVIGVRVCKNDNSHCTSLPSQGYKITSMGTSGASNRKLTVFKGYPQTYLPYLSYGLFVAK